MVLSTINQGSFPWVFSLSLSPPGVNCASSSAALWLCSLLFEPFFHFSLPFKQVPSLSLLPFLLPVLTVSLVVSLLCGPHSTLPSPSAHPFISCLSAWTLPHLSLALLPTSETFPKGSVWAWVKFFLLVWRQHGLFCRILNTEPKALGWNFALVCAFWANDLFLHVSVFQGVK